MKTLVGLALSLVLLARLAGATQLPFTALEDLKESDVVDRNLVPCGDQLVPAFALHPDGKGWWMFWITANGWILAYFGDGAEPPQGARSNEIYYGRWAVEERGRLLIVDHQSPDPGAQSAEIFCGWLVPEEKPQA